MLKLNAGLSRKVGEPDYGSRGASVNLELEVEGHLVSEPEALLERIRRLFALARQAVDAELDGHGAGSNGRTSARPDAGNGSPAGGRDRNGRPATAAQVKAIRAICDRLELDADAHVRQQLGIELGALSLRQASALIDALKAQSPATPRGQ